jgi:EAL domain-containing protein (putative c-di-GMP-specific phosphodiesterase class I)
VEKPGAANRIPCVRVNWSAQQFHDPELVTLIVREVKRREVPGERLISEVTDNVALLEITDTAYIIKRLSNHGIVVAPNDLGTGFSPLAYLVRRNQIIIKINLSFSRSPNESRHNDRLLETKLSRANNLVMTVLAKGIETAGQLKWLQDCSSTLGERLLFSLVLDDGETVNEVGNSYQV